MTRHHPEFGNEINPDFVQRVRSYKILTSDFRGAQVPVGVSVNAAEVKQVKSVMDSGDYRIDESLSSADRELAARIVPSWNEDRGAQVHFGVEGQAGLDSILRVLYYAGCDKDRKGWW